MTDPRIRAEAGFAAAFGGLPSVITRAPGRVNLIGEHTDYNDGFVLPAAISLATVIAARARNDGEVRAVAIDLGGPAARFDPGAGFIANCGQPWANYVAAMAAAMHAAGFRVPGAELAIAGSIPRGSGLSSSASLCIAVGTAFAALAGKTIDPVALARCAQAAECDHVGTRCGIMDQLASARGQADHALLIDCRSLETVPIPIPEGLALLIVDSGISRGLVDGEYNARRAQCEAAARALGVVALRDLDRPTLEAARDRLDPLAFARARHVIAENARTLDAAEALRSGDLVGLGETMAASHVSMRDDFAITLPAIDALVAELRSLVGREGGARMTGGGFGGAVITLLPHERVDHLKDRLTYRTPAGTAPLMMVERASAGAQSIAIG